MNRLFANKTLLLIVGMIVIFLVLIIWALLIRSNPKDTGNIQQPTASSDPLIPEEGRPFEVLVTPPDHELEINESVTFAFSIPVKVEDIVISVDPPDVIRLDLDSSETTLTVAPENYWQPNTEYVIKVLTKTVSINNKNLLQDQEIRFKTKALSGM